MKFERVKNAKRNGVWGIINKIASIGFPFAVRTVLIYSLGSQYLGLGSLFTSILTVLNLTELGVGSAIVFSMYKPIAEDDHETICALLNLYKKIYRALGIIILLIGLIIIPFLSYLIKSDLPSDINLYILYVIYLVNTCISYWLFAYKNCLLHAYQRDDVTSKTAFICNVILNAAQVIVLVLFKNFYIYVIIIPIITVLNNFLNAFFSNKLFPSIYCRGSVDSEKIKDIRKRVLGLSMIKVAAVSRNSLDSVILSTFLGLNVVAMYNNYYYVSNAVASILLVITVAVSAGIGNAVATQDRQENYYQLRLLNFLFMAISGLCSVLMLNIYQPFMKIWVGEQLMFEDYIAILFVVYFYVSRVGDIQAQYFDAAGLWWIGKWRGLIEAASNLFLNLLLGYYFGVVGIVLATIISILFINIPLSTYYTFKHYFNFKPTKYIIDHLLLLFTTLISGSASYVICVFLFDFNSTLSGILNILCRVGITLTIYSVFLLFLWRYPLFKEAKSFLINRLIKKK